jgi:hypothetical protein
MRYSWRLHHTVEYPEQCNKPPQLSKWVLGFPWTGLRYHACRLVDFEAATSEPSTSVRASRHLLVYWWSKLGAILGFLLALVPTLPGLVASVNSTITVPETFQNVYTMS